MKLLIITSSYTKYLQAFYSSRPDLRTSSYREQKEAYEEDAFGWASCWRDALRPYGWDVHDIVWNAEPMQRAWAREKGGDRLARLDLKKIALQQAKEIQPDLVWFDDYDRAFLKALRQEVPSLRRVMGWVGSAIPQSSVWPDLDLVLSCAPESVRLLRQDGYSATYFPHSFDPRILERLSWRGKTVELSFVGQLVRFSAYHLQRDALLEQLAAGVPLEIYTPSATVGAADELKALIKVFACRGMRFLQALGISETSLCRVPVLGIVAGLTPAQCLPVNPRLKPNLRQAVYGLKMYQLVADSLLTLNIHADSSRDYASNMRLYEVTGAGSCLITDWKQNLAELFEEDREVVSFKSAEECLEKAKWLLEHPDAAAEISRAGQQRTLNNYTFAHRAPALAELLEKVVSLDLAK